MIIQVNEGVSLEVVKSEELAMITGISCNNSLVSEHIGGLIGLMFSDNEFETIINKINGEVQRWEVV